jgi:hypothetical protein
MGIRTHADVDQDPKPCFIVNSLVEAWDIFSPEPVIPGPGSPAQRAGGQGPRLVPQTLPQKFYGESAFYQKTL